MTGRRWAIVFAAGVLAVLGALSWVTAHTLRLERSERAASNEARHQELVRLVLWRMDSALTPIIAREAARPYFEYQPFYPVDTRFARQAAAGSTGKPGAATPEIAGTAPDAVAASTLKTKMPNGYGSSGVLRSDASIFADAAATPTMVPSPLLSPSEPHVRLYFEQDATGVRTSPQIPEGEARRLADAAYVTEYSLAVAEDRLAALNALLIPAAPDADASSSPSPTSTTTITSVPPGAPQLIPSDPAQATSEEVFKQNINEYRARQQATQFANRVDEPRKTTRRDGGTGQSKDAEVASNAQESGTEKSIEMAPAPAAGTPDRREVSAADQSLKEQSASAPTAASKDESGGGPVPPASSSATREAAGSPVVGAPADGSKGRGTPAAAAPLAKPEPQAPGDPARTVIPATAGNLLPEGVPGSPAPQHDAKPDSGRASEASSADVSGVSVRQGQFAARWIVRPGQTPELIFEREMDVGDRHFTQGIWLDWPALKQMLLETAQGLLPSVDLVPILDLAAIGPDDLVLGRTLAAIPVELIAPTPALADRGGWTPARTALALMWIAVVGAIIAAGVSLTAAAELAQRRGQFVSAVTHELRTPLTTFCLYSQMLADGIVTDADAQKGYFQTLKNESTRLARIVESVLDYARLSGRTVTRVATDTPIDSLIVAMDRVLRARCEQSGMHLDVKVDAGVRGNIRTDHTIVERILFNLVENACKYAAESEDPTIHLNIAAKGDSWLEFTVQDHGPGIDPVEHSRIFRPFIRGSRQAHGGIPGLGLGLALAQGLARELGGELELRPGGQGACFVLRLPIAAA
jgi:signal transduction histidine kinase